MAQRRRRHDPIAPRIPPVCARSSRRWSRSTQAIIASPTGTARMPTQGSWRPLVTISVSSPVRGDRPARRQDRRGRLDREAHDDVLPGGDAAEDPARMVRREDRARPGPCGSRRRSRSRSAPPRAMPVADLDPLDRVDRHHRRGEVGVELAVDRRAEPRRARPSATTSITAPTRIAGLAQLVEIARPAVGRGRRRGTRTGCARPRPCRSARGRCAWRPIATM